MWSLTRLSGAGLCACRPPGRRSQSAYLPGAELTDANLLTANLREAVLDGADLTGARLSGATLGQALLIGAGLPFANLTDADLEGVDVTGATFVTADEFTGRPLEAVLTSDQLLLTGDHTTVLPGTLRVLRTGGRHERAQLRTHPARRGHRAGFVGARELAERPAAAT
jgi:uncharacterized protein YjbI with pentapeptide repeats